METIMNASRTICFILSIIFAGFGVKYFIEYLYLTCFKKNTKRKYK